MDKESKKDLQKKIASAVDGILSRLNKTAALQAHKAVKNASRDLAKKFIKEDKKAKKENKAGKRKGSKKRKLIGKSKRAKKAVQ